MKRLQPCARLLVLSIALGAIACAQVGGSDALQRGRDALGRHDYASASEHLRSAFQADPKNGETAFLYGLALFGAERFPEAIAPFETSARIMSSDALPLQFLARSFHKAGRSDEAIATFQRALELAPGDATTVNQLGAVYLELDRIEEALGMFEQAIAIDADYGSAQFNTGVTLFLLGRVNEAQIHLERAIVLDPSDSDAAIILGDLFRGTGEIRKARDAYAIAADRVPDSIPARARVVRLDRELRDLASAEHRLREVAEQVSVDADLWRAVADLAVARGKLSTANRALERALTLEPDSLMTLGRLADLAEDRRELENARTWLERITALAPNQPNHWCRLSRVCEALGDRTAARAAFQRSVDDGNPVDKELRCVAQRMLESDLEGIRNRALGYRIVSVLAERSGGKDASLLMLLGSAEAARGDRERAATAYERAAALFGEDEPAQRLLKDRVRALRSDER